MEKANRIMKMSMIILLVSTLSACSNAEQKTIDELQKNIISLQEESYEIEILRDDLSEKNNELHLELETKIMNIETYDYMIEYRENFLLDHLSPVNLTELNSDEMILYTEFKKEYDEEILRGSSPIVVTKMYLFASYSGDYETAYELFVTDEEYVLWTKDEHIESYQKDTDNYEDFFETYNLQVKYNDSNGACLFWSTDPETISETSNLSVHIFHLTKENEIWRVDFLPIQ